MSNIIFDQMRVMKEKRNNKKIYYLHRDRITKNYKNKYQNKKNQHKNTSKE